MQLKALIKNKAAEKKLSAQLIMQNYMMERLLERISVSEYKNNFILKGGFLIAAIVGLDSRATMDLDTTIKGFTLSHESISKIFEEICSIEIDDEIKFDLQRTNDIREGDEYPGIRVSLAAIYPPLNVPLSVDVTTGDRITPKEIEYSFKLLFDDRSISIMAYNVETVLAEKLETILSRNVANTRPRDFYDVHILAALQNEIIAFAVLKQALDETAERRGSQEVLTNYKNIVDGIQSSTTMRGHWEKYQKEYEYALDITFDDTCNSGIWLMDKAI